jgi:hypothetical protein
VIEARALYRPGHPHRPHSSSRTAACSSLAVAASRRRSALGIADGDLVTARIGEQQGQLHVEVDAEWGMAGIAVVRAVELPTGIATLEFIDVARSEGNAAMRELPVT